MKIHKSNMLFEFVYLHSCLALIAHKVQSENIVAVDLFDEY